MASYLLIRHKVTDFKTWKVGYDTHQAMRTEAGLTEKYLLRSADDPNEVVALFEAQDIDRAKRFRHFRRATREDAGIRSGRSAGYLLPKRLERNPRRQCLTIHSSRTAFFG